MRQESLAEMLVTILIYIFVGYAIFSIFAGLFPIIIVLILAFAFISGVYLLYRFIHTGFFEKPRSKSNLDEHGSRKIKASVIEMKEFENKDAERKD